MNFLILVLGVVHALGLGLLLRFFLFTVARFEFADLFVFVLFLVGGFVVEEFPTTSFERRAPS